MEDTTLSGSHWKDFTVSTPERYYGTTLKGSAFIPYAKQIVTYDYDASRLEGSLIRLKEQVTELEDKVKELEFLMNSTLAKVLKGLNSGPPD